MDTLLTNPFQIPKSPYPSPPVWLQTNPSAAPVSSSILCLRHKRPHHTPLIRLHTTLHHPPTKRSNAHPLQHSLPSLMLYVLSKNPHKQTVTTQYDKSGKHKRSQRRRHPISPSFEKISHTMDSFILHSPTPTGVYVRLFLFHPVQCGEVNL